MDNGPSIKDLVEFLRERSKSLVDMAKSCVMFYSDFDSFDEDQANKIFQSNSKEVLENLLNHLTLVDDWSANNIHLTIESICESRSIAFGKVGQPFRLALSGDGKSGSIDKSAEFVGKERTLNRLKMAIDWIDIQNN